MPLNECPSFVYSQDGVDHVQSHLNAVPGVVVVRLGQPRDAVVAVAQDLDAETVVVLKEGGMHTWGSGVKFC